MTNQKIQYSQLTVVTKAPDQLEEMEQTIKKIDSIISSEGEEGLDKGVEAIRKLEGDPSKNGRIKSTFITFIDYLGFTSKSKVKKTGYDENFKCSEFRNDEKGFSKDLFERLEGLKERDQIMEDLKILFFYSRIRTHEYIHLGKDSNETNGHPGGLFNSYSDDYKFSGQRTSGSKDIHDGRQEAIEKVINEAVAGLKNNQKKLEETKKEAEIKELEKEKESLIKGISTKSNEAALEFLINKTIGYRDNPEYTGDDKKDRGVVFKGYTATGMDLSNEEQREYALKTFQSVRDKMKLTILKLCDLLHDGSTIEDINIALSNKSYTKLRSGTPYSNANLEKNISTLKKANGLREVLEVVATETPAIVDRISDDDKKAVNKIIAEMTSNDKKHTLDSDESKNLENEKNVKKQRTR